MASQICEGIIEFLEDKKDGWSPFEMHIVNVYHPIGTIVNLKELRSYRILLKRTEKGSTFYYNLIGTRFEDRIQPSYRRDITLQSVHSSYDNIYNSVHRNLELYATVIDRRTGEVKFNSELSIDTFSYKEQYRNIFRKFDTLISEYNPFLEQVLNLET